MAQNLVVLIDPGNEPVVAGSCSLQGGARGSHRHHSTVFHSFAIKCYGTASIIIFKGNINTALYFFMRKSGQSKGARFSGAVGGVHIKSKLSAAIQCNGKGIFGQNSVRIDTVVVRPGKTNNRFFVRCIGNDYLGRVEASHTAACGTFHHHGDSTVTFSHRFGGSRNLHIDTGNRVECVASKKHWVYDALHHFIEALHQLGILLLQQQLPLFQRQFHTLLHQSFHTEPGSLRLLAVQCKIHLCQHGIRHIGSQTIGFDIVFNLCPQGSQSLTLLRFCGSLSRLLGRLFRRLRVGFLGGLLRRLLIGFLGGLLREFLRRLFGRFGSHDDVLFLMYIIFRSKCLRRHRCEDHDYRQKEGQYALSILCNHCNSS